MTNDRFTKALLILIAAGCAVSAVRPFSPSPVVQAAITPARQHWEYKRIVRSLAINEGVVNSVAQAAEDGQPLPDGTDIVAHSNELGAQGWELVSVTPYSNDLRTYSRSTNSTLGPFTGESRNGVTTIDQYIFKRLKP